jgi:hypothetical protein
MEITTVYQRNIIKIKNKTEKVSFLGLKLSFFVKI